MADTNLAQTLLTETEVSKQPATGAAFRRKSSGSAPGRRRKRPSRQEIVPEV